MNALLWAQAAGETYWRFNRLYSLPEGWHWLVLGLTLLGICFWVVRMYRRDGVEMARGVRWSVMLLRLTAIAALVFFFLDLEKGAERSLVKHSRVLLLVDTSLSMTTPDAGTQLKPQRRIDAVVDELKEDSFVQSLRAKHDVVVYRFDQDAAPQQVASFKKLVDEKKKEASQDELQARHLEALQTTQFWFLVAAALAGAWLLSVVVSWILGFWQSQKRVAGWVVFAGVVALICGGFVAAAAHLQAPQFSLATVAGLEPPKLAPQRRPGDRSPGRAGDEDDESKKKEEEKPIDWKLALEPRGVETRIGDTLDAIVQQERGGPIAGVVVFTDGGQNAGLEVATAALRAQDANLPVFPVGVGSDKRPINVRVVDVDAPKRAYPKDDFPLTGYLQAYGMEGREVTVELYATPRKKVTAAGDEPSAGKKKPIELPIDALVLDKTVKLGADGEVVPVRFQTAQADKGQWNYHVRVAPPESDKDPNDNLKSAMVDVLDRRTKVLLMAGGPTREFRFLRNLLFRDEDITSHVYLQTGQPGISQESDELLFSFPELTDELFQYDAIIAFDPNWLALSDEQIALLERWVGEQAGGLIVVAGAVNTPGWANLARGGDPRIDRIKALYPVVFYTWRSTALSLGRFGGDSAWPMTFTQDGKDAEFLWLGDDSTSSEANWATFEGVYGYYAVKDPKPGARIYARFSDPDTAIDGDLPIYMAGHFYGAGRVFFQASGEMWRVRAVDDTYFQQYYTKLIRWVSTGRLLRDSRHGVLLVDKERCLIGDHLTVNALLQDAQHRPEDDPEVTATLVRPDGTRKSLVLRRVRDAARDGMYSAQFTATEEGDFRIELLPPDSSDNTVLTRTVRARVPALETEQPQRNDALLRTLAERTNGNYYVGMPAATKGSGGQSVTRKLETLASDQINPLAGIPDRRFAELLRGWLMALIAGALCLEWTMRRLSKLA